MILKKDHQSEERKRFLSYSEKIEHDVTIAYDIANKARKKGYDPEDKADIPIARDMAERVEGLMSAAVPEVFGKGMPKRIKELEQKYGVLDWRVAFRIAEEVSREKFCRFENKKDAMEAGIRAGFLYNTLGIVSAPLEGFIGIEIKKRNDEKEYIAAKYAGPIRGAGGTSASVSLLLTDHIRKVHGYEPYDPDDSEVARIISEVHDYHDRVTNLQYHPTDSEIDFLIRHVPIEISGEPTENMEVSSNKDLPRIDTNQIRGGVCLVLAEGLAQKCNKIWKRLEIIGDEIGIDWKWIPDFIALQKDVKSKSDVMDVSDESDVGQNGVGNKDDGIVSENDSENKADNRLSPNYTFIADMVAGRPVFTYPMKEHGFRLRYGRGRNTGFHAVAIHPHTMHCLHDFAALATQFRMERPGKSASIVSCDTIDAPIVRLKNGEVIALDNRRTEKEVKELVDDIEEIIFLGDILINYGDFSENGHMLVPAGYCPEWWALELERAIVNHFGALDMDKASEILGIEKSRIKELSDNPLKKYPTAEEALLISKELSVPLHPKHIFYWKLVSPEQMISLLSEVKRIKIIEEEDEIIKVVMHRSSQIKSILESAGVPHKVPSSDFIVIDGEYAKSFLLNFGILDKNKERLIGKRALIKDILDSKENTIGIKDGLDAINQIQELKIRDKSGTFIGARMGRPEKAKMRKLKGSPHTLFPLGDEGGRIKSIQDAAAAGKIIAELPIMFCSKCKKETSFQVCDECGSNTREMAYCHGCRGVVSKDGCKEHGTINLRFFRKKEFDVKKYLEDSISLLYSKEISGTNGGDADGRMRLFKRRITGDSAQKNDDVAVENGGSNTKKESNQNIISEFAPVPIRGVKGMINKNRIFEHIGKGVLRAKHDICVNKDGTVRYDFSEEPITHFKPKEIGTSIEKLRELGYLFDHKGKSLESEDQIVEIFPQDIIISGKVTLDESCSQVMFRTANFVDDLLVRLYGQKPYYNMKDERDVIGKLVIGLAPHISAGMIGRIIGLTDAQACFASPLWHAALRRDCDGDEACIILLMDGLLNFSRQYLPDRRGGRTMDAPLVLTTVLNPSEVDDQALGIDIAYKYTLSLYEAALEYKYPKDVKVEQVADRIGTDNEFFRYGFTHDTENINNGVKLSAYKTLPSMQEKLDKQMLIAEIIRAVDTSDVARLIIERHFLKDTKGNFRRFSMQKFRCSKCNENYRRPPLAGKCEACGGRLMFSVSEGSVIKYLQPSLDLAEKYGVPPYMKQTLELLKRNIEGMFGKDKETQEPLVKWTI